MDTRIKAIKSALLGLIIAFVVATQLFLDDQRLNHAAKLIKLNKMMHALMTLPSNRCQIGSIWNTHKEDGTSALRFMSRLPEEERFGSAPLPDGSTFYFFESSRTSIQRMQNQESRSGFKTLNPVRSWPDLEPEMSVKSDDYYRVSDDADVNGWIYVVYSSDLSNHRWQTGPFAKLATMMRPGVAQPDEKKKDTPLPPHIGKVLTFVPSSSKEPSVTQSATEIADRIRILGLDCGVSDSDPDQVYRLVATKVRNETITVPTVGVQVGYLPALLLLSVIASAYLASLSSNVRQAILLLGADRTEPWIPIESGQSDTRLDKLTFKTETIIGVIAIYGVVVSAVSVGILFCIGTATSTPVWVYISRLLLAFIIWIAISSMYNISKLLRRVRAGAGKTAP